MRLYSGADIQHDGHAFVNVDRGRNAISQNINFVCLWQPQVLLSLLKYFRSKGSCDAPHSVTGAVGTDVEQLSL